MALHSVWICGRRLVHGFCPHRCSRYRYLFPPPPPCSPTPPPPSRGGSHVRFFGSYKHISNVNKIDMKPSGDQFVIILGAVSELSGKWIKSWCAPTARSWHALRPVRAISGFLFNRHVVHASRCPESRIPASCCMIRLDRCCTFHCRSCSVNAAQL